MTYWNAFVAVNELHGTDTFFDERFDNAAQFPIAAKAGPGHMSTEPDSDQVTSKLPALHFYQLGFPAVQPRPGIDFDPDAAERGDELFSGKANCNSCHRESLGQNRARTSIPPRKMKIDSFEADRAPASIGATGEPVHGYRTMSIDRSSMRCLRYKSVHALQEATRLFTLVSQFHSVRKPAKTSPAIERRVKCLERC